MSERTCTPGGPGIRSGSPAPRCLLAAARYPLTGPDGVARRPLELVVLLIAAGYGVLAFVLPHPYPSFDEAKYLAIGMNALAGRGPETAFGITFLPHSPFWPMLFALPASIAGLSPWPWGYFLNALAGIAVLLLAGRAAARFGPVGRLAAVAVLVGWLDLFLLTRTARLDVPEAALSLAYLAAAMSAINTGLVRRGVLAGALFAWAFLVKESSLVLLAAPFIAAIALRQPTARIARAAGLVLLVTIPLVSWWFVWYASATGHVYVFGLSSAWLGPLALGVLLVAAVLLALGSGRGLPGRLASWLDVRLSSRPAAHLAATVLGAVWVVAFLFAFSASEVQQGRPLLDPPNIVRWLRSWLTSLSPIVAAGVGLLPALVVVARGDDRPVEPLVAVVCGAPWVLLVAVLGEPPRNDIAVLAMLVVVGVGGWLATAAAVAHRPRPRMALGAAFVAAVALSLRGQAVHAGVAASLLGGLRPTIAIAVVAAVIGAFLASERGLTAIRAGVGRVRGLAASAGDLRVVATILVTAIAVGSVGAASVRIATAKADPGRTYIADQVAAWLKANVPAGSTVMFGSVGANETALVLGGAYRLRSLQATIGVTDPAGPLGVRIRSRLPDDLVAMDRHPRQDGSLVFTASDVNASLHRYQPAAWVYVTGVDTATPSMVGWLATVPGITLGTTITSPANRIPLVAHIYLVDMATLNVPSDRTFASSDSINALLDGLGASPDVPQIAAAWLTRLTLTDTGAKADATMARLRQAAGQ